MSGQNNKFSYTYSASEQQEIAEIRKKYVSDKADAGQNKLEQLRRLDAGVAGKAMAISLSVGIIGALVMGMGMSLILTDLGEMLGIASTFAVGITVGVIGMTGVILAYPLYRHVVKRERRKIAPRILELTDELSKK